ncbi:MAG: tetratricopeptide repeat protein, partial [Candidatus Omnitrophica bacterium]|nr:tetratricopeptide repeat protein [Candidatus Omnitrophota bacterium]
MLTSIAGAAISRTQALEGFVTAEAFYKQGEFAQAASAYEEILTAGGESGAIYYNLGNTYYKMGELGKAMLNYEKARQLIPRDSDLNFNYHYLRSKLGLTDPAVSMNF